MNKQILKEKEKLKEGLGLASNSSSGSRLSWCQQEVGAKPTFRNWMGKIEKKKRKKEKKKKKEIKGKLLIILKEIFF
jgi:hypothetical protein